MKYGQGGYSKYLVNREMQAIRTDAAQYTILVYTRAQDTGIKIYENFINKTETERH